MTARKAPVVIDLSAARDLAIELDAALADIPSSSDILAVAPARLVRTRRFALTVELSHPLSHRDLDDLSRAAAGLTAEETATASLYRQPAAFILGPSVTATPPVGEMAETMVAEVLDLAIPMSEAGAIDRMVSQRGHRLADVLTPHEALAYAPWAEDDGDTLLIHAGPEDLVVSVASETGLAGAGSLGIGAQHISRDLHLCGFAAAEEAEALALSALRNGEVEDAVLRAVDARIEEMASFAHRIRSSAHRGPATTIALSGLGARSSRAADIFTRVLDREVKLVPDGPRSVGWPWAAGVRQAAAAPRRIEAAPLETVGPRGSVFDWLRRHI